MARMPTYDEIVADFERGVRAVEHAVEHPFRHAADAAAQPPAQMPATMAAATAAAVVNQEDSMSLSTIAGDIRTAIGNADSWVKEVTETHLPAILAQAQKYENSPVVQALENAFLPPAVEQQVANIINELAKTYPAPADPAPTQQQPVQQPAGAPAA